MVSLRRFAPPSARLAALVLAILFGTVPSPAVADDVLDPYVRDLPSVARAVERIAGEAHSRKVSAVLVAFDTISFAPPPGRNEFRADHALGRDLETWLDALHVWQDKSKLAIEAVATTSKKRVLVGAPGWREAMRRALAPTIWDGRGPRFEPALAWMKRHLPRGRRTVAPGLVVLVATELTPERWVEAGGGPQPSAPWRGTLLKVGTYWDEEAIASALGRAHCSLFVVAPEVRFGDEVPAAARPELPWAARPQRPPPDRFGAFDGRGGEDPYDQLLRRDLEKDLAGEFPDPVERKREIDRLLGLDDEESRTEPADGVPPAPSDPSTWRPGGRYTSGTPVLFPHYHGTVLFVSDVPSGFGYWPYARAAAATGGLYLFYPFPVSTWYDRCPRDPHQLKRLAPPLVPREKMAKAHAGDPALDAVLRATQLVTDATPWSDQGASRRARGWAAWTSARPLRQTPGYRARRKPSDMFLVGRAAMLRPVGRSVLRLLPRYAEALALLDDALARVNDGRDTTSSPRAVADLRLVRFEVAMSAYHLQSLGLTLTDIESRVPPTWDETTDDFSVSHHRSIKLSDCLDAYDERTLGVADEAQYPRLLHRAWVPPGREGRTTWEPGQVVPGQQGNLLAIATGDPAYRARRSLSAVLKNHDPRLVPAARRMIQAAQDVMTHDARTPWGWNVYYAEALCYLFDPVDGAFDRRPRSGDEEGRPDTPWDPTPPPSSSPTGPATGGG